MRGGGNMTIGMRGVLQTSTERGLGRSHSQDVGMAELDRATRPLSYVVASTETISDGRTVAKHLILPLVARHLAERSHYLWTKSA